MSEYCAMYSPAFGCMALKRTKCDKCSFYKSKSEYEKQEGMSYAKMLKSIRGISRKEMEG